MYIEFVLEHCFSIDESDKQFDDVLTATRVQVKAEQGRIKLVPLK